MAPNLRSSMSNVAAIDRCGGFPTAAVSWMCHLRSSMNFVSRPIREMTGVLLRSTDRWAKWDQRSASSRRRNVSLAYLER